MASTSPDAHGRRLATAATAPATAPRTVVAAAASLDGSDVGVFLVDLEAAARTAVLRFAVLVFVAARFAAVRFFGDVLFARLAVVRFADFFDPAFAFAVERLPTVFFLDARFATPCLLISLSHDRPTKRSTGYGGTSQDSSRAYRADPDISAAFFLWTPSANSSIIFLLKAGMSSGLRDVTRPLSTTTSWSPHSAPALRRSVASDGHDVTRRPFTAPASISVHGAWQIAAMGFPASNKRGHAFIAQFV